MYASTLFSTAFSNFLHWLYGCDTGAEAAAGALSLLMVALTLFTGLSLVSVEFLD